MTDGTTAFNCHGFIQVRKAVIRIELTQVCLSTSVKEGCRDRELTECNDVFTVRDGVTSINNALRCLRQKILPDGASEEAELKEVEFSRE